MTHATPRAALSLRDPEASRLARERADNVKLYEIERKMESAEAFQQRRDQGAQQELCATVSELRHMDEAVFDAQSPDEVLALARPSVP